MNLVLMLLMAAPWMVISQNIPDDWMRDPLIQRVKALGDSCDQDLTLSLTNLLLPENETFSTLCQSTFFVGCRDGYLKSCEQSPSCVPPQDYMRWIDAYTVQGKGYTCSVTYPNITDVFVNQGGYSCFKSQNINVTFAQEALLMYMKDPQSVGCGHMEKMINDVLNPLSKCSTGTAYYTMTLGYFEAVVKGSPCAGKINFRGSANKPMTSALLFISSILICSALSLIL